MQARRLLLYAPIALDLFLVAAHLLWPEQRWGQGRSSYFRLGNSATLASWFVSLQLAAIGALCLFAPTFGRRRRLPVAPRSLGSAVGVGFLVWSFVEATQVHYRLDVLGLPDPGTYESLVWLSGCAIVLFLLGFVLLGRVRRSGEGRRGLVAGLSAWACLLAISIVAPWTSASGILFEAARGGCLLLGSTLVLYGLARMVFAPPTPGGDDRVEIAGPATDSWWLAGVGFTATVMILLQVVLFRLLTISGDYLAAQTVLARALLGISVGALLAYWGRDSPWRAVGVASFCIAPAVLLAFGAGVALGDSPFAASLCLMMPFAAGSVVIGVALTQGRAHVVYFVDLAGAALGALLVAPALSRLREEGALLVLAACGFVVAALMLGRHPSQRVRRSSLAVAAIGFAVLGSSAWANLEIDHLNVVRSHLVARYPRAEVLFSGSSLAGRYDVVRRAPDHRSLSAYENGHITDTIRDRGVDEYRIDPRLPHTLYDEPSIVILGLSGDAITKTARQRGGEVFGVEINPVVVEAQRGVLVPFNGDSYAGIDVAAIDGRTYIENSERQYDWITLMNAHAGRGRSSGRAPSPEYLHTREAMVTYLDRLTERGFVNIEEPVSRPSREPAVWKLLVTMREALLEFGATDPERHFFIFQWRTRTNNYIQILMKRTPLSPDDLARLDRWLEDVDELDRLESAVGRQLGPITSKTTLLHTPELEARTTYARIVRGEFLPREMVGLYNLRPTTDARPFHFDTDGRRSRLTIEYWNTLWISLVILLVAIVAGRLGAELRRSTSHVLGAVLTGLGYLLVEVVLIQKYQIFIGLPVLAFATVLGTLLVSSGLGSLWSGRLGERAVIRFVVALVVVLALFSTSLSPILGWLGDRSLPARVAVAIATLAVPGFLMGVPFPFLMRRAKRDVERSAAALLFALNGLSSALAVPLALHLAAGRGFSAPLAAAIACYGGVLFAIVGAGKRARFGPAFNLGLVALLLTSPWWFGRYREGETDRLRVYGLSYGTSRVAESRVFLGGSDRARTSFEWLAWLIEGGGRVVLVDTGCSDPDEIRRWSIDDFVSPVERLEQLNITPEQITDVVLTHAHWDHAGDVDRYPNATIWIQRREIEHAEARLAGARSKAAGIRRSELDALFAAEAEGRLRRSDGAAEIAPRIRVARGGAHSPGSQHVIVETLEGSVVIAGDVAYHYRNHQSFVPTGATDNPAADLAAFSSMHRQASSPFYVLPGHDPRVMQWFDTVSEGIVRIGR